MKRLARVGDGREGRPCSKVHSTVGAAILSTSRMAWRREKLQLPKCHSLTQMRETRQERPYGPHAARVARRAPDAKMHLPLDHLYAFSAVISALSVGLDSGKMSGCG